MSAPSSSSGEVSGRDVLERIQRLHRLQAVRRLATEAEEQTKKSAAHHQELKRFLARSAEATDQPLKQSLALLGYFNVFLLLNVDSFTRDDLMSLVAIKLCATVIHPGLFLEDMALKALEHFFAGLHVSPGVLTQVEDLNARIVLSRRSGEWLLTDSEYRDFLQKGDFRTVAEPVTQIAKSLTIAHMDLRRVEASLQSLALLLMPRERSPQDRRGVFFHGLLELANACVRASLAENLEEAFVENALEPWAPARHRPPELIEAKRTQTEELSRLLKELASWRRAPPESLASLETAYATKAKDEAFKKTLFLRLRVLCTFQLQLVNVSAYNETGRATKLAAYLTKANLKEEKISLYLLLCFHAGLGTLGYDLTVLSEVLQLLRPTQHLLVRTVEEVGHARKIFLNVRALLKHVGKGSKTARYATYIREHDDDPFSTACSDFLAGFPYSLEQRPESSSDHANMANASDYEGLANVILQHTVKEHLDADEIQRSISAVTEFFLKEEAHAHVSRHLEEHTSQTLSYTLSEN